MPRACTVCTHPQRTEIDRALVAETSYRNIMERYGVSVGALHRHVQGGHIPRGLARATHAAAAADADTLLDELADLKDRAVVLLARAEREGDLRTALAGVREAARICETLLEVAGELNRQPVVNITLSAEWQEIRQTIITALRPYPEASVAVARALDERTSPDGHDHFAA